MKCAFSVKAFIPLLLGSPLAFAQDAPTDAEDSAPCVVVEVDSGAVVGEVEPATLPPVPDPDRELYQEQSEEIVEAIEALGVDIDDEKFTKDEALKLMPLIDEFLKRNDLCVALLIDLLEIKSVLLVSIADKPQDAQSIEPTLQDLSKRYLRYAKELEAWVAEGVDEKQDAYIRAVIDATGVDMHAYTKEDVLKLLAVLDELLQRDDWQLKPLHDLLFIQGVLTAQIAEKPEDLKSLMPSVRAVIKRYPQYAETLESWIDSEEEYSIEKHFEATEFERDEFQAMQEKIATGKVQTVFPSVPVVIEPEQIDDEQEE